MASVPTPGGQSERELMAGGWLEGLSRKVRTAGDASVDSARLGELSRLDHARIDRMHGRGVPA